MSIRTTMPGSGGPSIGATSTLHPRSMVGDMLSPDTSNTDSRSRTAAFRAAPRGSDGRTVTVMPRLCPGWRARVEGLCRVRRPEPRVAWTKPGPCSSRSAGETRSSHLRIVGQVAVGCLVRRGALRIRTVQGSTVLCSVHSTHADSGRDSGALSGQGASRPSLRALTRAQRRTSSLTGFVGSDDPRPLLSGVVDRPYERTVSCGTIAAPMGRCERRSGSLGFHGSGSCEAVEEATAAA